MDFGSSLTHLSPLPVHIDELAARSPGAFVPVVVPLAAVSPEDRTTWYRHVRSVPFPARIQALLDQGDADEAWTLIRQRPGSLADHGILPALGWWAAAELAEHKLPRPDTGIVLLGVEDRNRQRAAIRQASDAVALYRTIFSDLPQPLWTGGIIVVAGPSEQTIIGSRRRHSRPALPIIRTTATGGIDLRAEVTGQLTHLSLDLMQRGDTPWPAWLRLGMVGVAELKARGLGPLPRQMLIKRRQAGIRLLQALLANRGKVDADLATAVCAPLVHASRKKQLSSFLDLIRHTGNAEEALRIAYDLTVGDLVSQR